MPASGQRKMRAGGLVAASAFGLAAVLSTVAAAQGPKPTAAAAANLQVIADPAPAVNKCGLVAIRSAFAAGQTPDVVGCEVKGVITNFEAIGRAARPEAMPGSEAAGTIRQQDPPGGGSIGEVTVLRYSDGAGRPPPTPAPGPEPGPATPPGATGQADVEVKATLGAAFYDRGSPAVYDVTVINKGPSPATRVQLNGEFTNLLLERIEGGCNALPCEIGDLAPGQGVELRATATVADRGEFVARFEVSAAEPDPKAEGYRIAANAACTQDCEHGWPKWWLPGAGAGALLALAAGAMGVQRARQGRWRRLVSVSASVGPGQGLAGPIAFHEPALSIRVVLEPGEARALGPIPTRKAV